MRVKKLTELASIPAIILAIISLSLPACDRMHAEGDEHSEGEHHKIVATSPIAKDVTVTQQYVCQIHSRRNIEVRALQEGYLEQIPVKEGQAVKAGDVLFKVVPTLYKSRLDAELAEVKLAKLELGFTEQLANDKAKVVSQNEVALYKAKLAKAEAKAQLAEAELNFATIRAPFDGIIDRLNSQQGSLVKKEDLLTTLSDNSVMWVYFNVPEARYLEYMNRQTTRRENSGLRLANSKIELVLADGNKFNYDAGNSVTVEGKFNNETGNIPFRADFPNPDGLLRHGQTGTVLIHRTLANALVIPQRATYEILDKRYVYVVGEDKVVRQREIVIQNELDDIFVIKSGIGVNEKIILEGVRQVRDGDKTEYEFLKPEEALANQKHHAE